ncbi:MAG: hypothetical protein LAT51_04375 [Flavobacteriaceae bacterium]|nr:hypothetical protein [Flavobacteriaceae bacterium]
MKNIIKYVSLVTVLLFLACDRDDGITNFTQSAPQNVSAEFSIERDNSGDVTITPKGEGVDNFNVDFGDGSELSDDIRPGENVTHTYEEGEYQVTIIASNIAGDITEAEKNLLVSFDPPENLEVEITIDPNDSFSVIVTATADNAMGFEMSFGEVEEEEPIFVLAGEEATYTYSDIGTYLITVEALSGGEATTIYTEEVTITDPFLLPITFESETVNYNFNNFGGGEEDGVEIIDNPDPNDVNSSNKVGSYTKVSGSEPWAGTSALLNEAIDFSSTTTIAVDVYSPEAGIPVIFKIEQDGDPDVFVESVQNTTTSNEWETLTFNLPEANTMGEFAVIALFFNFDTPGNGETYLFDNIRLTDPVVLGLPLDFEQGASFYNFTEFEGAPTEVVPNPDQDGINTSPNVARTLKASGAATFAGSILQIDEPIDLGISSTLKMKVWSPIDDNEIRLKLESTTSDEEFEVIQVVNTTNEWVEVEFDFSGADINVQWDLLVFFFDFGNPGSGLEFYFDDLEYAGDFGPGLVELPLTFEGTTEFDWAGFGGAEAQVINNPDNTPANPSNRVTEFFKSEGSETWAGTSLALDNPIDFSASQTISMKVWSPIAGADVLLKIESQSSDYEIEVSATTSTSNAWEELSFDFTAVDQSEVIDLIVVFMDFGNSGNDDFYYFDDIQLIN